MSFRSILAALRCASWLVETSAPRRRVGFRLWLEPLEDRSVLSTLTVLNLADTGAGSLRQAVLDANALSGADTIHFADELQGKITLTGGELSVTDSLIIDSVFEHNEARGGNGNRGDGVSFQFVGTGTGGAIAASARNTSGEHASFSLSNVTLRHNRAVGGDGNTAGTFVNTGIGGAIGNNGINPFVPISRGSEVTLRDCTLEHNQAIGGAGGAGLGGGVANTLGGIFSISGSTLSHNHAHGGDGGNGFGGGIYNGAASTHPSNAGAETVLTVERSKVTKNHANGGDGENADGIGGGVYNLSSFDLDALTLIFANHASTSADDLFDPFT